MNLISKSKDIQNLCNKLSKEKFICIDTEFIREKYYFAKLCLLQIGDSKGNGWAIDTLVNGIDLSPVYSLLLNPEILKVFHAPRQDLEIIYKLMGKIPRPIFDTQSAGMACGFGDSVSYEVLVKNLLEIKIDKSSRYSDWSKRPLHLKQLEYAIADVTYLSKVYLFLNRQITKNKRSVWIKDEVEKFYDTDLYKVDPYSVWEKIKIKHSNPRTSCILREIAALREQLAIKNNLQKNMILKDDILVKISLNPPRNINDLKKIRGLPYSKLSNKIKNLIILAVNKGKNSDINKGISKKTHIKSKAQKSLIDMLNILLKNTAETHNISTKLIGNKKDMEKLASGISNIRILEGWRYDLFGKTALQFIEGKIAIISNNNKIIIKKL